VHNCSLQYSSNIRRGVKLHGDIQRKRAQNITNDVAYGVVIKTAIVNLFAKFSGYLRRVGCDGEMVQCVNVDAKAAG
jgi:hypothetical protein